MGRAEIVQRATPDQVEGRPFNVQRFMCYVYLGLFFFLMPFHLFAGVSRTDSFFVFFEPSFYASSLQDTGKIIASPLQWKSSEWEMAGLVLGVGLVAYSLDQPLKDWTQANDGSLFNTIGKTGVILGHPALLLSLTGAGYTFGYFSEDEPLKRISVTGFKSVAISQCLVEGLKIIAKRSRPRTGDAFNTWNGFRSNGKLFEDDRESFPSGHSAAVFAIGTLIAEEYSEIPWVAWVSYGVATGIAGSRVLANDHWLSDVVVGSAIGIFTTKSVLFLQRQTSVTLVPWISSEGLVVGLRMGL